MNVAVVIPVGGKHALYVSAAINSVLPQLSRGDELIVVEDRAIPPLCLVPGAMPQALIDGIRVVYTATDIPGRSAARNLGASISTTPWLYWLDADDILMPYALEDFRRIVDRNAITPHLVYADYQYSYSGGPEVTSSVQFRVTQKFSRERLQKAMIGNIGAFMRHDRFNQVGGFDQAREFGEEYDLWIRYTMNPEVVVFKHDRPFFHSRKGLHTVDFAAPKWTTACHQISMAIEQGAYAAWATR